MVKLALQNGDRVVATLCKPSDVEDLVKTHEPTQLCVTRVDVTQHGDIISAFALAKERFGGVDVVFNNAGFAGLS